MDSLNATPVSDRIQIGFFGTVNAGKSSLINAVTGQEVSVVSEKKGTTTDPVIKTMELKGLGPVVLIDTPGFGDDTEIGSLREKRTRQMLERADMIVVVKDVAELTNEDLKNIHKGVDVSGKPKKMQGKKIIANEIFEYCRKTGKPCVYVLNKAEAWKDDIGITFVDEGIPAVAVSAMKGTGINELKELLVIAGKGLKERKQKNKIVFDIVKPGDSVVLVIPIDASAPAGRLILPQQQVIRDIIDAGGNAICIKDTQLEEFFRVNVIKSGGLKPALVVTDSQVFKLVSDIVPEDIPLTSFSILMARYKGTLAQQVKGAMAIDEVKDGDIVLIAEGCTHHRQCEDIGTVQLPAMLKKHTRADFKLETSSGHGYPDNLTKYKLILHCGGCMLGESEVKSRIYKAIEAGVPVVNYGVAMAYMSGILKRSLEPIPEISL